MGVRKYEGPLRQDERSAKVPKTNYKRRKVATEGSGSSSSSATCCQAAIIIEEDFSTVDGLPCMGCNQGPTCSCRECNICMLRTRGDQFIEEPMLNGRYVGPHCYYCHEKMVQAGYPAAAPVRPHTQALAEGPQDVLVRQDDVVAAETIFVDNEAGPRPAGEVSGPAVNTASRRGFLMRVIAFASSIMRG